jgi:lipopolysaccharide transport protein LptA
MYRRLYGVEAAALLCLLIPGAACSQPGREAPGGEEDVPTAGGAGAFTTDCDSLSLDLKSNRSVCTNVGISNDEISIRAAQGTTDETSFETSEWQFTGGVTITFESARLTADRARFVFRDNALILGELIGDPVEITDYIEEQRAEVRGTAETILFDNESQVAELMGQATLALGANAYTGCDLIYHLAEKTFNSGSSDCGVRVTIFPEEDTNDQPPRAP